MNPLSKSSSIPTSRKSTTNTASSSTPGTQPPDIPSKPSSLKAVVNRTASNYSPYGSANRYGTTGYGATPYNTYSNYGSPYSRFGGIGGMGSMYGGGYGGMYGGGMGGMYGSGMYRQPGIMGPGDPNDPNSLTNSFSQSTQATFQVIENLVGAFGGVAQMLESTYMATHSSFFGNSPLLCFCLWTTDTELRTQQWYR